MNPMFEGSCTSWVRYDHYEWKEAAKGRLYLKPCADAKPSIYNPLKQSEALVLDAMALGRICMGKKPDKEIQAALLSFVEKYGLLGMMTAMPTTSNFMEYKAVYLPKNHFIKSESMRTDEYLLNFFPFEKPQLAKRGEDPIWNLSQDGTMMALALTFGYLPMAVDLSFQREYAEPYEWLKQLFTDWAFTFTTSVLYYEDKDKIDPATAELYRKSMALFEGVMPTYHIGLLDKPTIIWDFHSLLLCIQMMFSFMLTDAEKPLRMCRKCTKAFIAKEPGQKFCSEECEKQYNQNRK